MENIFFSRLNLEFIKHFCNTSIAIMRPTVNKSNIVLFILLLYIEYRENHNVIEMIHEDQCLLFVIDDQGHDHFHHGARDLAVVR